MKFKEQYNLLFEAIDQESKNIADSLASQHFNGKPWNKLSNDERVEFFKTHDWNESKKKWEENSLSSKFKRFIDDIKQKTVSSAKGAAVGAIMPDKLIPGFNKNKKDSKIKDITRKGIRGINAILPGSMPVSALYGMFYAQLDPKSVDDNADEAKRVLKRNWRKLKLNIGKTAKKIGKK